MSFCFSEWRLANLLCSLLCIGDSISKAILKQKTAANQMKFFENNYYPYTPNLEISTNWESRVRQEINKEILVSLVMLKCGHVFEVNTKQLLFNWITTTQKRQITEIFTYPFKLFGSHEKKIFKKLISGLL